ncbi:angiotensinogen [Rhineura floridana]|uniref:angiotensinogen n=1 Tax=Rhineura floridana TaxID=261503 RepID=UPI002AC7EE96|nr:angiotensinogen [Rhineura floridana]XP_061480454.1 angiotensinogen [Rhineura floridana]
MNPGVSFLCFLLCIIIAGCDRVYVHPFYLTSLTNITNCKKVEELLENNSAPFRNKSEEWGKHPHQRYLKDPIHILGARFYKELRKTYKDENILLSPTFSYESLLSFFIGASGKTALDLQTLLGFDPLSSDPNCTLRIDGHKVLSALSSIIKNPFQSEENDKLFFSKISCLFSAPEIHVSKSFVHVLTSPHINFFVQAVDFTNLTQAAEQINAFVEGKRTQRSKSLLADIDPETTLLFATYTQFKVFVKGASPLKEPQEFWLNSDTKISVPMMTVTGTFQHKHESNVSIIKIPIGKDLFLLLSQPVNNSELASAEAQYSSIPSLEWLQNLSPRQIHLTLPMVSFESIYDLQELLGKLGLPGLLGKNANLRLLSDTNLTIGKIINQQLLELSPSGTDEVEDLTEKSQDIETLRITLNKPFLLAMYEESGALLYFGRITNPLEGT